MSESSSQDGRPNVVLIVIDQQRGDCLGIEGHPGLQTPNLDYLARTGARFTRAYSACPVCIPARRTLMTGQRPVTHGVLNNVNVDLDGATIPGVFSDAGYQTHLAGKLHLHPIRKHYGFHSMKLADGPKGGPQSSDYIRFMVPNGYFPYNKAWGHGLPGNSWVTRPWHLEETLHQTNWVADQAIEFLETRDPTRAFFLNVSFCYPHPACPPPVPYYDRYLRKDYLPPASADWSTYYESVQLGTNPNPGGHSRIRLPEDAARQFQAAYFGAINHIDDQIHRFLELLPENTVIAFVSDHGEMMGDHQFAAKCVPYEGSARVPFLLNLPASFGIEPDQVIDRPVELMDIMPTLCDAAGIDIPHSVEGRSVLPLLRGSTEWRDYVHGEISHADRELNSGMHYLTDGQEKYIWWPGRGKEQLFDLRNDPRELVDLAQSSGHAGDLESWRARLVHELEDRPERFVVDGTLQIMSGGTIRCLQEGWTPQSWQESEGIMVNGQVEYPEEVQK